MKMTLLEIVQNILSAMDDDEINHIGDTVESLQIAEVVKETYDEIFGNIVVPEHSKLVSLSDSNDTALPNYMYVPDEVVQIQWIRYKNADSEGYTYVDWLEPAVFAETVFNSGLVSGGNTVTVEDPTGFSYNIRNDQNPQYYTSFDDKTLVFDSFDAAQGATLQTSKAICWAQVETVFEIADDFIPPIDAKLFALLLSESKAVCFNYFKQISSTKDEQRSRRQRVRWQKTRYKTRQDEKYKGADYIGRGRRSRIRFS